MNSGDTGKIQTYCRGELLAFLLRKRAWEVKRSPNELGYSVVPDWAQLPEGQTLGKVAGVASDSADRVYVFQRGEDIGRRDADAVAQERPRKGRNIQPDCRRLLDEIGLEVGRDENVVGDRLRPLIVVHVHRL